MQMQQQTQQQQPAIHPKYANEEIKIHFKSVCVRTVHICILKVKIKYKKGKYSEMYYYMALFFVCFFFVLATNRMDCKHSVAVPVMLLMFRAFVLWQGCEESSTSGIMSMI